MTVCVDSRDEFVIELGDFPHAELQAIRQQHLRDHRESVVQAWLRERSGWFRCTVQTHPHTLAYTSPMWWPSPLETLL